jgi:hypothetical protein
MIEKNCQNVCFKSTPSMLHLFNTNNTRLLLCHTSLSDSREIKLFDS